LSSVAGTSAAEALISRRLRDVFARAYNGRTLDEVFPTTAPAPKPKKPRRPSLTRLAAKAKKLGVAITLEPSGAVTVRADNTANSAINEWDEVLPHGTH
jgi:hypothetical protein